jgi:hypothetical protein
MSTSDELRIQAAALLTKAAELETPLTAADVSRMYKAREYDAIAQARQDGRLNALLSPTTQEN